MPQLNYIKRILELIQMDKKDLEIKKIIFKEYNIPLTEKSINEKRGFKIRSKPNKKDTVSNAENLRLVKKVIEKHNIDKTSKEIRALILQDYNLVIDKDEMKEILWTDLRKEITYDRKEYTYSLKSSYDEKENMAKKEQINNLALATLSPRIMFSINDLVLEKIQKFKISYYHSIPGYQTLEDNSAVEKLLISSLSQINIDKELSSTEENKYVLYGSISSRNFLNELKLVLQCFIRKQTKLNEGEINTYLKIVCNVELLTVDLKKLLASDLSYIFNRESIYYTAIKSKALNDLHEEVTNELFFYNQFIETFSTDGSQNKNDKVIADKKVKIIESIETSVNLVPQNSTADEKKDVNLNDVITDPKIFVKESGSSETEEIIRISQDLEKNIKKLNKLLNLANPNRNEKPFNKSTDTLTINNTIYHIIKKRLPLHPLFFYEFDISNGDHNVVVNIGNPLYNQKEEKLLIQIATAMISTKNTMTSKETEIFFNRFHHNLKIIE
jgi:hypothetical protein